MSDLIRVVEAPAYRTPSIVALGPDAPTLGELFSFMSEAELRVESLRMRIRESTVTARGEEIVTIEVALRHPGHARVVRRRGEGPLSRNFDVWLTDGTLVRTYDAAGNRASVRPLRRGVVGADRPDLPAFARLVMQRTPLPAASVADVFVHPHGFVRNVLVTGPVQLIGTTLLAGGREAFMLRADHPRSAFVLTDRPDHWFEIGVDRMTGFLLHLSEHVGDQVSRQVEVTSLELDPPLGDEAFELHLSSDVRVIY
jgi:hypothetical protein